MSEFFKKVLSPIVDFGPEKTEVAREEESAATREASSEAVDLPDDLDADSEVVRVRQAISLLSGLPLGDIPVEKARELIVGTLRFAGLSVEELLASFQRVQSLYRARIQGERQAISQRQKEHEEMVAKLEQLLVQENGQYDQEVARRNKTVEAAATALEEIEKAKAFFADKQGA